MDGSKSRFGRAATVLALITGIALGALWQPAGAQANPSPPLPPAPRTAYVEFLKLLKEDARFGRERIKIMIDLKESLHGFVDEFLPRIERLRKKRDSVNPDTVEYFRAMNDLTDVMGELAFEEIAAESAAKRLMKKKGIAAFSRLRELVHTIAAARGYTQVLNIARDPDSEIQSQMDFQALQKELLLSPVLYFEEEHDLTQLVLDEADKRWGKHIKLEVEAQDKEGKAIKPLAANKAKVDYEIDLKQTLQLAVGVTEKDKPAAGKSKKHTATVRGPVADGKVERKKEDGDIWVYTAPGRIPGKTGIIEIRFRSSEDLSVWIDVRIRVVDKAGKKDK